MKANFTALLNNALQLHRDNKLAEAETIYKTLLKMKPDDVNILNLYGLLCLSINKPKDAVDLLSKAVVLNQSAYVISNLAKAYYVSGNIDKAVILYSKAAQIEPSDDIFYSMAIAYKALKKYDEAINSYKQALSFNAENVNALYNLASLYKDMNNIDEAVKYAVRAEFINGEDEDIQTLLSTLYESAADIKKATVHLEKAFKINPKYIYLYNMAVLKAKADEKNEAIGLYNKVLALNPEHVETLVNIAALYRNIDKNTALTYLKKAYEIKPFEPAVSLAIAQLYRDLNLNDESIKILNEFLERTSSAEGYSLLAINFMDLGEYDKALENYNKALAIDIKNLNYLHGKAMALKYLGNTDDARLLMEYIVNKGDKSVQSVTTLGMMYLQEKKFEKGMELYIKRSEDTRFSRIFKDNVWTKGVSLHGKNVLVYSDCGLGDTIMFCRYIPLLKEISAKIVLQTDKELVRVLSNSIPCAGVISKAEELPFYDAVIPVMNIPYAIGCDFENIPFQEGYITADKDKIDRFKKLDIFNNKKLKIGIFYRGNKNVFKNRSVEFSEISKLFDNLNAVFYSFQIENVENSSEKLINLNSYINDFDDTAALLKCVDILVSIDSSVAHMAGALGVKTFLLLPHTAEWRWFDDVYSTPWYKSVRIFKQTKPSDWQSVIENVREELKNYAD